MLLHRFRTGLPECLAIGDSLLAALVILIVALAPLSGNAQDLSSPAGEKIRDVFIVPDALGSPAALLNEAGEVIWRQGYSPYGERLNSPHEPEVTGTVDYTGHQVDPSGLVYTGARYYDPQIGRFLSMDPAGFDPANVQSFNRYAYANNNPYRYVDPDGELPFLVPLLISVGKEAAGEVFEQVTGIPAPTLKNLGKAAIKQGIKKSAKARPSSVARPGGPRGLPDSTLVCRGGTCTADRFRNGSGVTVDGNGKLSGVSVNSAPGKSLEDLTVGIPNKQVGVTTVGDIRRAGGNVVRSPHGRNPNHATLGGITPEQAERLFTPTVRNPNAR